MGNDWETFLTVGWLALWFLFPLGLFMSVSRLDKNSDQIIRLEPYEEEQVEDVEEPRIKERSRGFHLPHWGLRH